MIGLALHAGDQLTRGDHLALRNAGLTDAQRLLSINDDALLALLAGSRKKLNAIRAAAQKLQKRQEDEKPLSPILPEYKA
jgi:hypothetical protein